MDNILNIIKQSFISFSGEILVKILGFFFKLYLVHNLLDSTLSLGIFALGIALIDFISPFTSLGFGAVSSKYLPFWDVKKQVKKKNNFISTVFFIVSLISLWFSLIIYFFKDNLFIYSSFIYKNSNQVFQSEFLFLLPIFIILMILKHQTSILNQILIGLKEVKKTVIYFNFIGFPLKFLLLIILLNIGLDFKGYLYSEIITLFFILISFVFIIKNILNENYSFKISFDWVEKKVLIYAFTFFILGFLSKLTGFLDKWLILKYMSVNDVGIYYVTFTFINFLPIILKSINRIFAPIISEIWEQKNIQEIQTLYQFFTKWTVILSFPIIFFVIFFNEKLLLLFGSGFVSGKHVLIILTFAHLISIMFGSVRTILQMTDKHMNLLGIEFLRTGIVVLSMILFIPIYQMEGAALSLGIGIILNNVINYIILYKHLKLVPYKKDFWKIGVSIILTTFILYFTFNVLNNFVYLSNWFWMILFIFLSFIVTILLARYICFSQMDKRVLLKILNK